MAGTMQCKAAGRVGTKSVRAGRRVNGRRGNACRVQASAASSGGRRELLGVLIGAAGAAGAALVQPATAYEEYNKYIKVRSRSSHMQAVSMHAGLRV